MDINFYSIFPILSSLFILFLGVIVFIKHSKSPANRAFSRFSLLTFIWLFSYGISYSVTTEEQAFFWLRIGYTSVILMPVGFYHIPYAFLNLSHKRILVLLYIISSFFVYALYRTDYFVTGLYKYFWGYYPKAGFLHPFYLTFFMIVVSACDLLLVLSWLKIRKETSLYKQKLQYILLAFIVCTFATVDYLPNYGIEVYPFGWIFIGLFSFIIAYAIIRYRLMDIHFVIKRSMVYSFSAGILTSLFVVLVLAMTQFLSGLAGITSFAITVIAALTISFLFNPLKDKIQKLIDRIFYKKTYDFYDTIQNVSHELSSMFDIKKIYIFIGDTLLSTFSLKSVYLLTAGPGGDFNMVYARIYGQDKGKEEKDMPGQEKWKANAGALRIDKKSGVIRFFDESDDIIIKEELIAKQEILGEEKVNSFVRALEPFNGEAVKPVFVDDKLTLLLIMGGKLSGDIFTDEDVKLIDTISHQTSIAFKNARLYAEKITSDRLASIGMVSATFAHEIRNPLTSIKTFAQLMPEKYNDVEFRENFSKLAVHEIERIDRLIKDLMSIASKDVHPPVDELDLTGLMDEVLAGVSVKLEMEKKNIKVEKLYGKDNINIMGDSQRLQQSFLNIINNGCQAMAENGEGVLKVDIMRNSQKVDVIISDTGKGIPPQDIANIFDPFYTTKPMGVGLGLAISKKIIEDHGGSIAVTSALSRGTSFIVNLPAKN